MYMCVTGGVIVLLIRIAGGVIYIRMTHPSSRNKTKHIFRQASLDTFNLTSKKGPSIETKQKWEVSVKELSALAQKPHYKKKNHHSFILYSYVQPA